MWLFAGLGNPGSQYRETRHNAGFLVLDELADKNKASQWQSKFHGEFTAIELAGQKVLLLKPQTFMNRSGISISEAARFYKISPENVVVFHDELDLPVGKLRCKQGGGHGGHNGLKSIDQHLGQNYRRVRIGIDHPGDKHQVHSYVLHPFSVDERIETDLLIDRIVRHASLLMDDDLTRFMSKIAEAAAPKPVKAAKQVNVPQTPETKDNKNGI